MGNQETMPLAEVAAYLGVSDYTVQSWAEDGGLQRSEENPFLFTRESVEALKKDLTERKTESFNLLNQFNAPLSSGQKGPDSQK